MLMDSFEKIKNTPEEEQSEVVGFCVCAGVWRTDNRVPPPSQFDRFDTLVFWMNFARKLLLLKSGVFQSPEVP